jgi:exopolysaccharide production protein ExoZ
LIVNRWLGVAAMVACAAFSRFQVTGGASAIEVYSSAYNLEFFCGMAAYGLYRWGRHPWALMGAGLATLGDGLILAAPLGSAENGLFALVIAGATIAEDRDQLTTPKGLVALGGASYSLYLIHVPVIGVLLKVAMLLHLRNFIAPAALWWMVLIVTTLIAYGAWLAIEKPIQSRLRSRARSGQASTVLAS